MPKIRKPHYIERNTHLVKLKQILAYAKNKDTSLYREEYLFGKLQQIQAYAKKEDTSVYREESTLGKIKTNTSLCQK